MNNSKMMVFLVLKTIVQILKLMHAECHGARGFTLFTDSEVRHVRCDYVMHYSIAYRECNLCKSSVSETKKSKVRANIM